MKSVEIFLEFNGKSISILRADGTWWIPLRPICEALNVQFENQRLKIQEDDILCELPCEHMVVAADGKLRKMLCLPEKYIYGWIFSIRSDSEGLKDFKLKCYDILYNHFHGALTFRVNLLNEKSGIDFEIADLKEKIANSEDSKRVKELTDQSKKLVKSLKEQDADLAKGQTSIAF